MILKNSFVRFLMVILIGVLCGGDGYSAWVAIDTNAPISAATGDIATPMQVVAETGTEYVRVNFILGPWSSPADATHHGSQNLSWFETYDIIINGFVSRGVKVYGLIGAEAVHSSTTNLNSDQYVNDYAANFVQIVGHFKDRVRVYEGFNEPNDWAGGTTAQVQPYWFAKMLEEIYRGVKINDGHKNDSSWQVTLVSGPVFSHDQDTVATYFNQVYSEGKNNLGWSEVKTMAGSYPLDGIGYHIYVAQGSNNADTIRQKMLVNINAIWEVVQSNEETTTTKKLWISEFGWRNDYVGSETAQAQNLETGFGVLLPDSRIQLATWFCLKDFPSGYYGLFRVSGTSDADKKPAWYSFNSIAIANRTPLDSFFLSNTLPKEMSAEETAPISITIKNTGNLSWSGIGEENPIRLSAGNENAQTGFLNSFIWSNFQYGGYCVSPIDAKAFLGETVSPNQQTSISFSIKPPYKSGAFPFSARMFNSDSSEFFGDSIGNYILVRKNLENALLNYGFESGNLAGWTKFGEVDGAISGTWFADITAKEGSYFVGSAANYGTKNGGLFQQIDAFSESTYGARVFIRTYRVGGMEGDTACRLGLDPEGGIEPSTSSILWTSWVESEGQWTPIYQFTNPSAPKITFFLQFRQQAPDWNITCFDDCILLPPLLNPNRSLFLY